MMPIRKHAIRCVCYKGEKTANCKIDKVAKLEMLPVNYVIYTVSMFIKL